VLEYQINEKSKTGLILGYVVWLVTELAHAILFWELNGGRAPHCNF
jgi:hypothetical protein